MKSGRVTALALAIASPLYGWHMERASRLDRRAVAVADSVVAAERHFLAQWGRAWEESQVEQHGTIACVPNACPQSARIANLHCHRAYTQLAAVPAQTGVGRVQHPRFVDPERFIGSRVSPFAVCPSWYPGADGSIPDERVEIDYALTARHQRAIHAARDTLIAVLEQAARSLPQSDLVVGQLVRFLVDQNELTRAVDVSTRCGASAWWCAALRGYALGRAGFIAEADSAYLAAIARMPDATRCAWTDLSVLLEGATMARYKQASCAQRASLNDSIWWLADPLYVEPGNERRVEHYTRWVLVTLRSALDHDERFDWRPKAGSDARSQMVIRYGWPSYTFWAGFPEDTEHTLWLEGPPQQSLPDSPYTTYEYTRGRVHALPSPNALMDPMHAREADWALTEPARDSSPGLPALWWPREHFAPNAPLFQLPVHQTAFLRRRDSVIVAVATTLDDALLNRALADPVPHVSLMATHRPDSVFRVMETVGRAGASVATWGMIAPRPMLIGLEIPAVAPAVSARTRFAIAPPSALSALAPGASAVSDPVILHAVSDGTPTPATPDSALSLMSGSTHVLPVGRIGVYWETYGFSATDTVEFAIWVERHTPQGIVRRLTNSLQITRDLNTPVATNWTEIPGERRVYTIDGPVRVTCRSVSVDVSHLPRGAYWLDVAARVPGHDAVRGRTEIFIQ